MTEESRRDFLQKGATATAAAFTIVAPQTVRGYQANSKISVGLIGCGNRGSYDASIAHADPRARVTAICDRFEDQFDASKKTIKVDDVKTYTDWEKILAAPDIDAIFIVSPPFEHPRMLEAAVQAKKHIYLEKPIGVDVDGVKRAMKAAKAMDKTKTLSVGFQQRQAPPYLEAYKRVKNGDLGEIICARSAWIAQNPFTPKPYSDPAIEKVRNWFRYRELSGDIIVEQDCHNLDALHWFLGGLPLRAVARGNKRVRKDFEILDNISVIYEWPNGLLVNFEANQLTPRGFNRIGEEFTGTKGSIQVSRGGMTHYNGIAKPENVPAKRDITIDAIEAFIGRIVNNEPENVVERAALSTCIALMGRQAAYTGKETTWKSDIGITV
jgi:myo-inositol 2-dehydrogenase / D-chiro-inositol 1-dehydrogenase